MQFSGDILILIPARYHSSRFPGKPLALINGKSMVERVWNIAQSARNASSMPEKIDILVATEDERIIEHCESLNITAILTSDECKSGTERAYKAVEALNHPAKLIINLQGDNALCPPWFITALIEESQKLTTPSVITPMVQLRWNGVQSIKDINI